MNGQFFRRLLLRRLTAVLIAGITCASAQTIHLRLQTRELVKSRLKSFSTRNRAREALIREWFGSSGCKGANLSEQAIDRILPPNIICVLPGETQEMIVVGAHTDKVAGVGDGVVDNWTGAVLLPALFYSLSLNARPHHHTFVFVGFSAEEKGLIGSGYYVDHMADTRRARIEGMVNIDSLGLGPTRVWISRADKGLLDDLSATAKSANLPLGSLDLENGATADSESFNRYQIPLSSVTPQTWSILHSPRDTMAAIKMEDYYDSYKLIADYLAYLDDVLKPASAPKPDVAAR